MTVDIFLDFAGGELRESHGHQLENLLYRSARIVDGTKTSIENVPWQVCLVQDRGFEVLNFCGGSIISCDWVVTAAHCVCNVTSEFLSRTFVSAGSSDFRKGSRHKIVQIFCHPLHESRKEAVELAVHDIALLKILEPFDLDATRQPIPLYTRALNTLADSQATASGWGAVNLEANQFSFDLKAATMRVISLPECRAYLSTVYNNSNSPPNGQLCARPISGKVCTGDSGGPLTVNGTLVGLDSWRNGDFCTRDYPSVFTEVAQYRYWISEITLL